MVEDRDSILTSVKKAIGIEEEDLSFDLDITMAINTAINRLSQIGVGPDGFVITDKDDLWSDLLGDRKDLEGAKTYIIQKVRLMFDPPQSGFLVEAINKQLTELEWTLNIQAERVIN
jgi:hypothetical protein